MIEIKKISQIFKNEDKPIEVFSDLSFSVKESEVVAILGPSGCGKSTLLKMIAGLVPVTDGEITISDKKVIGPDSKKGFIFQNFSLFPWLTVEENIGFSFKRKNLSNQDKISKINHYLQITGLEQFRNAYPKTLSGGMQQRVALARTLASEPEVLLMDEPFGALDSQTRSYLQDFFLSLLSEVKKTTIFITHDPEEALYLADRIIILSPRPSKIIEDIRVPFDRNRMSDLKYNDEFQRLKKYITYLVYAESIRAKTDEVSIENKGLIIGSNIWTGVMPLYLAQQKGIYKDNGLAEPHLVTLEWSDKDRLMPLREGIVDILNIPLDQALIEYDKNPDLRIIMPIDVSTGGDVILAQKDIKTIADLKGKIVALETGWVSNFFMAYMLNKEGLSLKDIKSKDVSARYIPSEMINKKADAGCVQEPWLSQIRMLADMNVIASTKEYPIVYSVLITKASTLRDKGAEIKKLKSSILKSIQYFESHSSESITSVSPILGLTKNDLEAQLSKLHFVQDSEKMISDIPEIEAVLLKEGLISKKTDLNELFA